MLLTLYRQLFKIRYVYKMSSLKWNNLNFKNEMEKYAYTRCEKKNKNKNVT